MSVHFSPLSPAAQKARHRRRWFGGVCLFLAVAMLVVGETFLSGRLSREAFLLWWLGCFGFTILAVFTALLDLRLLRRQSRLQQTRLFTETLIEIKGSNPNHSTGPSPDDG